MKKHIVLIEDDTDDLRIFLDAMKDIPGNYKCTYANCPGKGLNMLKYICPDYIFVDLELPTMSGLDMLGEIKKDPRLQDIPSFLFSSRLTERVKLSAVSMGITGCFEKPSTSAEMTGLLGSALSPLSYPTYFVYGNQKKIS